MKRIVYAFVFICVVLLSVSCEHKVVYSHFEQLPDDGWLADSALIFDVAITDTLNPLDVVLYVRHTEEYAYQNMWLFMSLDGVKDTIEFYLADQRGRWLGNGFGNRREMPVLYAQGLRLTHPDTVRYTIWQGMREDCLQGVSEIGIEVRRN